MKTIAPSVQREIKELLDLLIEGDTEIITIPELEGKLARSITEGPPLRIKQGIDPTSPDVHIGHMVPYRKMRLFQDAGHIGVLIIGDFTAQIGDPTDRKAERVRLDHETTTRNAETYCRQIFRIVDEEKAEVHWQSRWFNNFALNEVIDLASEFSVAHLLSHDTFRKRLSPGKRLSLHELLYPTLQAMDSLQIHSDVELGGMDQKFNILCGRDLMRAKGLEPQVALLTPLLPGTDGRKMSKSFGNHIPVESTAKEKIGPLMSIADEMMRVFMALGAGVSSAETKKLLSLLSTGAIHPKDLKMSIAKRISLQYHPLNEVEDAADNWEQIVSRRMVPSEIKSCDLGSKGSGIIALLTEHRLADTTSEARRLIKQGAVSVDGQKIGDIYFHLSSKPDMPQILKVGKKRFLRIDQALP
ncbi:MAG: tyrosine--tRNA ligase [Spirochaetales bacterium]|jgi:tyrosyl-tRNA synthetase|nr:tyrosine--tRNA ligase [Spirochaetales bacterium]